MAEEAKIKFITSTDELNAITRSTKIVVSLFYSDAGSQSKLVESVYAALSAHLSRPRRILFSAINTGQNPQLAFARGVTGTPTFMVFKHSKLVSRVRGARAREIPELLIKLVKEAEGEDAGFGEVWVGAALPPGFCNVTDETDMKGVELLNSDSQFGGVAALFGRTRPTSLDSRRAKQIGTEGEGVSLNRDWVESDADDQLMLYVPFRRLLKLHTIHLTSLLPDTSENNVEIPMRPKTIHLYSNRVQNLGFEEAEDMKSSQSFVLSPEDWDENTGTAKLNLFRVKFQNLSSLVMFVYNGDGEGERVRLDRLRFIGEAGEKWAMDDLVKVDGD